MGSKTGRNLTAKEESIENNVRYVEQGRPQPSFSSGKENEDTGRTQNIVNVVHHQYNVGVQTLITNSNKEIVV